MTVLRSATASDVGEESPAAIWRAVANARAGPRLTEAKRLELFCRAVAAEPPRTLVPLLPLLFNLKDGPYTLDDHFPFEPLYQTRIPRRIVLRTGRQVGKSSVLASRGTLLSATIPHFSTIFVTPLFEQIRRFSTQYVRPLIDQSPVKRLWSDASTDNSVLQKSFKNLAKMFFSFAYLDANRLRGLPCDCLNLDELQDIDANLIPIIVETLSASRWRLQLFAGTPKTLANTIEGVWNKSSQAEWCIPCPSCKKLNVPRLGHDLLKMIGPSHPGIGPPTLTPWQAKRGVKTGVSGIVCAKCDHWLDPRTGFWVHEYPERRWDAAGYHVPQIVMPMHCQDRVKWGELVAKRNGYQNTTPAQFHNEVLGEGYDVGSRLLTKTDLQAAAVLPWANRFEEAAARAGGYDRRILGVDWGGGGEDEVSFTTAAVIGVRGDGGVDVLYGERSLTPHDHLGEARRLLQIYQAFGCSLVAHDYNGAGNVRETVMAQAGLSRDRFVPCCYYRSAAIGIMIHKPATDIRPRPYWHLDKARALTLVCQAIKSGLVRTFQYDWEGDDRPGLLHDFLALVEHKAQTIRGPEIYTIQRHHSMVDDFAHAVTFAACTAWHMANQWPNVARAADLRLSDDQTSALYSLGDDDWR